jgi:hypothetical protein
VRVFGIHLIGDVRVCGGVVNGQDELEAVLLLLEVQVPEPGLVFSSRNLKAEDAGPERQVPLAEVAAR